MKDTSISHNHIRHYGSNTIWLLAERMTQTGLAFLVGIFIARTFGPAMFGVLNFAISYGLLFISLVLLGMDQVLVKELVQRPEDENAILGSAIAMRLAGFTVLAVLVPLSGWLIGLDRQILRMLVLILLGYLGVALNGIDGYFQAHVRVRYTAVATITGSVLFAGLNLWGCFRHYEITYFAFTNGMIVLFTALLKLAIYHTRFGNVRHWRCRMTEVRGLLKQSSWLFYQLTLAAVTANIGYLILKFICDDTTIGYYSIVSKIAACLLTLPEVLCNSLFPAVVKAVDKPAVYRRRLDALYFCNFWGGALLPIGAALFGKWGIMLLYGKSYALPGEWLWLGLAVLPLAGASFVFSRWSVIERKQRAIFLFAVGQAAGAAFFIWLLGREWGFPGAVASGFCAYFCGWLLCAGMADRETRWEFGTMLLAFCHLPRLNELVIRPETEEEARREPEIDLFVGTLGRKEEFVRFLRSLRHQHYRNYRVFVCDQNPPEFLAEVRREFSDLPMEWEYTDVKGLSAARNRLLRHLRGEIFAFPDDDCEYEPDTLTRAVEFFRTEPEATAAIGAWQPPGNGKFPARAHSDVGRFGCFYQAASYVLFFRTTELTRDLQFDETFGVGEDTRYKASEDTDYLLRILEGGGYCRRVPTLRVRHPAPDYRVVNPDKTRSYGVARMALLRKHRMPWWFQVANLLYPLVLSFVRPRGGRYYRIMLEGRWRGWREMRNSR